MAMRLTGKLDHGGIIPIYRIDHDPQMGIYYVMRYVKGQTLRDILVGLISRDYVIQEAFPPIRFIDVHESLNSCL